MINSLIANSYNALPFGISFGVFTIGALLFFILMVVVIILKGYALWIAAKRDDSAWFVAILILNTLGILELVYLYFIVGKWRTPKSQDETKPSQTPPPTPSAQ